jgi:hypothetical protein
MANDIMVDIESLDTSPNCVILTIGAVRFDPKGSGVVEKLELRPTIEDQTERERKTRIFIEALLSDKKIKGSN